MKNAQFYIIIAFLGGLVIGLFPKGCSNSDLYTTAKRDTILSIIKFDSSIHYFHTIKPEATDSFIVEVPAIVDTMGILKNYFNSYSYSKEFRDSSISAMIFARVNKNRLDSLSFNYRILRPTSITTILESKPKIKVFAGFNTGIDRSGKFYLGPQAVFMNKKENLYTTDLDLINKGVRLGILWKLSMKKKPP
jgi:hypothetical protein